MQDLAATAVTCTHMVKKHVIHVACKTAVAVTYNLRIDSNSYHTTIVLTPKVEVGVKYPGRTRLTLNASTRKTQ